MSEENCGNLYGLFGIEDNPNNKNVHNSIASTSYSSQSDPKSNGCCICSNQEFKYRCPRCELKTCSLDCCKQHKIRFNCNGLRDKTKYVKISDFDQSTFISDYLFLENIDRVVEGCSRERNKIVSSSMILKKKKEKKANKFKRNFRRNKQIQLKKNKTKNNDC